MIQASEAQEDPHYGEDLPCGICGEHKDKYTNLKATLCAHLDKVQHTKICYDCYGTKIRWDNALHRYEMGVDLKEAAMCSCCGQYRRKTKFVTLQPSEHSPNLFSNLTGRYGVEPEEQRICKFCYEKDVRHCTICHGDVESKFLSGIYNKSEAPVCIDCGCEKYEAEHPEQARKHKTTPKETITMANTGMSMERMMGGAIGPDNTGRFKASMMGIAIKDNEGIYCIYNGEQMIDVMDFILPGFGGIFRMPTTKPEAGDLLLHQDEAVYVREVAEDNSIEVLNPLSNKIERLMPKGNLMGFKFFIKLVSMTDMMGFKMGLDSDSDNPFASMMPMMLMSSMMGGGGQDPFSSMFGGGARGGSESTNPLGGMMGMLMMSQLFGGANLEKNPLGNLFGGLLDSKKTEKKSRSRSAKESGTTKNAETPSQEEK